MICTKCGKDKHEDDFETRRSRKVEFKRKSCLECGKEYLKNYYKTKDGLISKIYGHQTQNSKKRGHSKPTYNKQELKDWLYSKEKFHVVFNDWVNSGYEKDLIPSIDRKNDYKGYSFSNIQITTWRVNNSKAYSDRKKGINNKGSKAVDMLTLNGDYIKSFHSMKEAERSIDNIFAKNIVECCKGRTKTHAGFKWRYSNVS
jgi:hypothetical protein